MNIILQIIIGLLLGDICAAFFHWYEDSYLHYCNTNFILSKISKDNEMHHYYPRIMINSNWYETIKITFILAIIIISLLYFLMPNHIHKYPYLYIFFFISGTFSNLFHKWSHMRVCELNPLLITLQKYNIIIGHKHHSMHHNEEIDKKYAVIFPITNLILDNIQIFRLFEYIIYKITNIKPDRKKRYDDYKHTSGHEIIHDLTKKEECPRLIKQDEINTLYYNLDEYYQCKNVII